MAIAVDRLSEVRFIQPELVTPKPRVDFVTDLDQFNFSVADRSNHFAQGFRTWSAALGFMRNDSRQLRMTYHGWPQPERVLPQPTCPEVVDGKVTDQIIPVPKGRMKVELKCG
jgi:hypothetical protein